MRNEPQIVKELREEEKQGKLYCNTKKHKFLNQQSDEIIKSKNIIDSMLDGFSILDTKRIHIDVNPALCKMTGFSKKELIGTRPPHPYWPEEEYENIKYAFNKTLEGDFKEFELTLKKKNGKRFSVLVSPSQIIDKNGKVINYFVTVKDISERKISEEKIKKSEERYNSLFNETYDWIYVCDFKGNFIDANPAVLKGIGYTREDLKNLNFAKLLDKGQLTKAMKETKNLIKTGKQEKSTEYRLKRKDGSILFVDVLGFLIYKDGKPNAIQGIARDITEEKIQKEKIKESEEKYRNIVEMAPDGILTISLKGIITSANPTFLELSGFSEDEIVGKHYSNIPTIFEKDRTNYSRMIKLFLTGGSSKPFDFEWKHKSGEKRYGQAKLGIMKSKGKRIGIQAIVRDTTNEKTNQELISYQNKEKDLINNIISISNQTTDLNTVLSQIFKKCIEFADYDGGGIYLAEDNNIANLVYQFGLFSGFFKAVKKCKTNEPPFNTVFEGKKPHIVDDLTQIMPDIAKKYGIKSTISIPIVHKDKVIGCINIASKRIKPLIKKQINTLISFCIEAGNAISKIQSEINEKKHVQNSLLLSNSAIEFAQFSIDKDVYEYIGNNIQTIAGKKVYVTIAVFDKEKSKFIVNKLFGYSKNFSKINKYFSGKIIGKEMMLGNEEWTKKLKEGSLTKISKNDFKKLILPQMPKGMYSFVKKIVNIDQIYTMGLVREEKIYGLVFLAAYKNSNLQNIGTIETFVNQAAVAIQRNDAIEELQKINLDLSKKVRERTKEVEDLLKQKDDFINQLGHDLKNPLTPLMTLIPIINKKTADPEIKKMLGILDKNVHFMKNLIAKTIELAKLNSPNTTFDIEEVNLLDEINKIIEKNQVILEQNKIIVDIDLRKDQYVKADKLRLSELFDNLITNSIKYSPEDCLINIKSEEIEDFIKISIKDNGIGLTKEQQKNIFYEFYKVDLSRGDYESSGLGLPICKKIVEKLGGKLWVESKGSGKGSTFHFTLKKGGEYL